MLQQSALTYQAIVVCGMPAGLREVTWASLLCGCLAALEDEPGLPFCLPDVQEQLHVFLCEEVTIISLLGWQLLCAYFSMLMYCRNASLHTHLASAHLIRTAGATHTQCCPVCNRATAGCVLLQL
jgi:hypothetical protein